MRRQIPPDATVTLNLRSATKALDDLALLLETNPVMSHDFVVNGLRTLADRYEEIAKEKEEV